MTTRKTKVRRTMELLDKYLATVKTPTSVALYADQLEALKQASLSGPVAMLNLLKFKEHAEYEDGRETNLSGREAYQLYAEGAVQFVTADGGRLLHSSETRLLLIGDGDLEWDMVGIVEYPSVEKFVKLLESPEFAEFGVHRSAGLAHQLLIACGGDPLV